MIQVKGFIIKLIAMVSVMGLISQGFAIAALASYRNEVARSMSQPVSVGPRGEDGTNGVDGKNVTQKQVDSAVAKYLAANPPDVNITNCAVEPGKAIVGLSVTVVAGNFVAVCVKASVHTPYP